MTSGPRTHCSPANTWITFDGREASLGTSWHTVAMDDADSVRSEPKVRLPATAPIAMVQIPPRPSSIILMNGKREDEDIYDQAFALLNALKRLNESTTLSENDAE